MLDERRISERAGEQANPVKETGVRREMGRRSAPADQLMYAWSMSATRPNPEKVTQTVRIIVEECPPEVYLG